MPNHGGTIRQMGYLMRERVEELVGMKSGRPGRRRATHVAAMIEVSETAYDGGVEPGFFNGALRKRIRQRLKDAHLQPQESGIENIYERREFDKDALRAEIRSNLERLLGSPKQTQCIKLGLELHILLEMHMRARFGERYKRVVTLDDIERHKPLREAFGRCMEGVPELILTPEPLPARAAA